MKIRQSIAWIAAALLLILGAAGAEEPTILEDPEGGRWEYHSESLNIVIEKFTEKQKEDEGVLRGGYSGIAGEPAVSGHDRSHVEAPGRIQDGEP